MAIVVVSLGGTIASTSDGDGASPSLSGRELVDAVPGLGDVADVDTVDFANEPSPHLTYEGLFDLVERLDELDSDPETTGVVVTQGTDVLEESAYFVDLCYDGRTPVAFTGAMRNPSLAGPDGPANLLAAVRVAADGTAREEGTLVCFNDRVHAAREVTKTNATNVDTFRSPEFGPLAVVDEDRVTWRRRSENPDPTLAPDRDALSPDVEAVTVTLDMSTRLLDACADSDAVCLAALGAGHVPPQIIPALEALGERDVPIVATTRCPEGRLARRTYDFRGSERTLRELGCRYSDLNLQKTRVRTVAALAADRLDDAFTRP